MGIAQRIHDTVEDWQAEWKDRLRGWMLQWVVESAEKFMDDLEPPLLDQIRATFQQIKEAPDTPPEFKAVIEEALTKKSYGVLIMIAVGVGSMIFGMVFSQTMPSLKGMLYYFQRKFEVYRLDPGSIISVWRRDKVKYEKFFDDLRDQGWSENRIDMLKELAKIIPPLPDMVRFADFAAFDPEVIAKWREFYDAPSWITEPFSLLGVTGEWANKYWFSHWIQPGRFELGEMHRRELITDDEVKLAYRTMGYSSYWQNLLLELVKAVPTRVDVRRFWDMRTIDEARLREIYHARGYYDKDLEDYVLWTKVYVAFPDLVARFKNGWITESDVFNELLALGMPDDRIREMIETKIKPDKPERVIAERDLTKTDIYRGVKKEVITWSEGTELLQDLGYDADEADYILAINVGALEGSPETYLELKQITQLYRKAEGLKAKLIPSELIEAGKAVAEAKKELTQAEAKGLKNEKLAPYLQAISDAEYRYRQLLIQWQQEKQA